MAPTPRESRLSRTPAERAGCLGRTTMKALAYLLGARALGIARTSGSSEPAGSEAALEPLATTDEARAAWRRWAAARETFAAETMRGTRPGLLPSRPRPSAL